LYKNSEFVKALNETYQKKIYPIFSNASTVIDDYVINMPKSIEMNIKRWNKKYTMYEYYKEVLRLKAFIEARTEHMKERYSTDSTVLYTTYVKNDEETNNWRNTIGWEDVWKKDGQVSGKYEKGAPIIEDIKIVLSNSKKNENIKYNIYTNKKGWLGWKYNGNEFGTADTNDNICAIKIELEGMFKYKVAYRVYIKDSGWQEWKHDGEIAGDINNKKIIQGIQIKVERK